MSSLIPFSKVESIGNDFVLIEEGVVHEASYPEFAIQACRRRFAIGSDGLLVVGGSGEQIWMRMFNPDGTEDFCGNGLRCAAHYAHLKGYVGSKFTIAHLDRFVACEIADSGEVKTNIGKASFKESEVPHTMGEEWFLKSFEVAGQMLLASALTTGSTHLVIESTERPDNARFNSLGPILEHHPRFPNRTSVIWAWETGTHEISIRIWERGVGETKGCGTGSSAAGVVWMRKNGASGPLKIENPGGLVTLHADTWDSSLTLEGTARRVFSGEFAFQAGSTT